MGIDIGKTVRGGALLVAAVLLHSGCGVAPIPGEAAPNPGESSTVGSSNKPRPTRPVVDAVPGEQSVRRPVQLLVTGGIGVLESGLFTLSSAAKEALPRRIGDYRAQYLEATPVIERGRVAALTREKYGQEGHSIQLLNFATGQEYNLYRSRAPLSGLTAAPIGKWLAFNEGRAKDQTLRLIDVLDEKQFDVGASTSGEMSPVFSADGKTLYFERRREDRSSILRVAISDQGPGMPETFLESTAGQKYRFLRFSPNNSSYVVVVSAKTESQLVLKHEEGEPIIIASGKDNVFEPAWSPDGKQLLFWMNAKDGQTIRTYDLESGRTQVLSLFVPPREPGASVCPAWSPDMSEVYYASNAGYWDQIFKTVIGEKKPILMTDANLARSYSCPKVLPDFEEEL